MSPSPLGRWLLGASALAVIALAAAESRKTFAERDAAVAATTSARAALVEAQRHADESLVTVTALRAQAEAALAQKDTAVARADVAQRTAFRLSHSFAVAAQTAPDNCRQVIAAADSALSAQDTVISDLRSALTSAQDARSHLRAALDTSAATIARLQVAGTALVNASGSLVQHVRGPLWVRIAPKVGVGLAVGITPAGTPALVAGFTLGWTF